MQVVVDGILTHYEIVGGGKSAVPKERDLTSRGKEKLLILHGWKRSLTEWLPIAKILSEKYQVILLDLPGFGQTARPEYAYSIYDYATFTEHFLDKLEIKKVILLGHSFGGRIGIILGAKTKRLTKLILVDAAGVERRSLLAKIKIVFFKVAKIFLPRVLHSKLRNRLGSSDYKSAGEMRTIFLKVINEDLTYLLPKVTVNTFIIWGDRDREVEQWKTKLMKEKIPDATLRVVWEAGHSPYLEKPREFVEIIKENLFDKG